ncbi:MAG TPA: Holliday junction resolvase-like protein [Treponemataceae bacterium]|nr:Holliday junction resolvase-like protein [Treponemataceae bacterium]
MTQVPWPFALIVAVAILAGLTLVALGYAIGSLIGKRVAQSEIAERVSRERVDAVKRSRAVLGGQFSEQLAPYLPGFPGDPTECRFIGKPVDFVTFSGASAGAVDEILFIEVKTGGARLSPVERSLKECVESGRVRYVEYRVPAPANSTGTNPAR